MSRLCLHSPGLSPNVFADVLTAMDMTFFFYWAKVFPLAGSWTLFLMTAGCGEEHCWAGGKQNDHQWASTFLLAWLTAKSMGLWKEHPVMLSAVTEWWNVSLEGWRPKNTALRIIWVQYFKYRMYHYDVQFSVIRMQSGAKISTRVGFWKLIDSVDSSPNQKGTVKVTSTEIRISILMSNWQCMFYS